ncbi:hypothetical protein [Rhizobium sp. GCM10022189]|uniref:hypothetical protein n=1 Tax=Rhizobium sp. GCM10022189 TaxID=3252654 RepID=UPI00361BE997
MDVLHSIDKRLELVAKMIGYLSIFVITPSIFILAKLGFDINSYFNGPELSTSQKEIILSLKNQGYDTSADGALIALKERSPLLIEYLKAGLLPKADLASYEIKKIALGAQTLPGDIDQLRGWFRRDSQVTNEIRPILDDANKFIERLSVENAKFTSINDVCSSFGRFLVDGKFSYVIKGTADCKATFFEGTAGAYLSDMVKMARYWNELVGIPQPPLVSKKNIVDVATMLENPSIRSSREATPMTPSQFGEAKDGQLFHFTVESFVAWIREPTDTHHPWHLGVWDQTNNLKEKQAFKINLHRDVSDAWLYGFCQINQVCELDFLATFFENKIYLVDFLRAKKSSDHILKYHIDYDAYEWKNSM